MPPLRPPPPPPPNKRTKSNNKINKGEKREGQKGIRNKVIVVLRPKVRQKLMSHVKCPDQTVEGQVQVPDP